MRVWGWLICVAAVATLASACQLPTVYLDPHDLLNFSCVSPTTTAFVWSVDVERGAPGKHVLASGKEDGDKRYVVSIVTLSSAFSSQNVTSGTFAVSAGKLRFVIKNLTPFEVSFVGHLATHDQNEAPKIGDPRSIDESSNAKVGEEMEANSAFTEDDEEEAKPIYSSRRCVGGEGHSDYWRNRTCILYNVCYWEKEIYYYRDPDAPIIPMTMDRGAYYDEASHPWVALNAMDPTTGNHQFPTPWQPVVIGEPLPADAVFHEKTRMAYMTSSWLMQNFGHVMAESMLIYYSMMELWGEPSYNDTIAFFKSPDDTGLHIIKQYWIGVSSSAAVDERVWSSPHPMCFKEVLVGSQPFWRGHQMVIGRILPKFSDFVVKNLGMDPHARPTKQHVVINMSNRPRRYVFGLQQLKPLIERILGVTAEEVHFNWMPDFDSQIAAVRDATVFVAMNGGSAFRSVFMSRGTAVILIDEVDIRTNTSQRFFYGHDAHLFSSLPDVLPLWLQVDRTNVVNDTGYDDQVKLTQASLLIDPSQLLELVALGLSHVERHHGWRDTFKPL